MRRALVTFALLLALVAMPAAQASAARSLSGATAKRYAERAATNRAKRDPSIVAWSIVRGFRFESRKWVWVWSAERSDGTICGAQLVTRYASRASSKVIAYFRMETCS